MDLSNLSSDTENSHSEIDDPPLAKTIVMEKNGRAALIKWKPNSNIEAQVKLLYIVQYLISSRTSLNPQKMAAVLDSVAHLTKKDRD